MQEGMNQGSVQTKGKNVVDCFAQVKPSTLGVRLKPRGSHLTSRYMLCGISPALVGALTRVYLTRCLDVTAA